MAKYSTFIYNTAVLYGWTTGITSIFPDSGPSIGGEDFVVVGEGFDYDLYDDDFTAVTLNLAKWTDISSGTGSVATGTYHLQLNSGATASGIGGIEMVGTHLDTQFEARINVPSFNSVYPSATVNLFTISLYVDANNYANLELNLYANKDLKLETNVYKGGIQVSSYSEDWTVGLSVLKLLRFGTDVYFYANGALFASTKQFVTTAANFRFFVDNRTANYSIIGTIVESIESKTFVAFDNQVVHDPTMVSGVRLRGITPASVDAKGTSAAYQGLVDISVVAGETKISTDSYEYVYLDGLTLLDDSQSSVKISIIDDDTVRTPSDDSIGLGGGK